MSEQLDWAKWWIFPWQFSHPSWSALGEKRELEAIFRSHPAAVGRTLNIDPCLPSAPDAAILRLALASFEQIELMLALVNGICCSAADTVLNEEQHLWCMRLAKALNPDALMANNDDPLRLLRSWVGATIWQRLRLRFVRQRVLELENKTDLPEDTFSRLDTLWHAVIWRMTPMTSNNSRDSSGLSRT